MHQSPFGPDSRGEHETGENKTNCFPRAIPPNSKYRKKMKNFFFCLTSAGTQICGGFEVHDDLIKCESKVQGIVSLES